MKIINKSDVEHLMYTTTITSPPAEDTMAPFLGHALLDHDHVTHLNIPAGNEVRPGVGSKAAT